VTLAGPDVYAEGTWAPVAVRPVAGDLPTTGGVLLTPLGGQGAEAAGAWRRGRYVVEVRPGTIAPSTWFGVEIVAPLVESASPSSAPPPSPTSLKPAPAIAVP